MFEMLQRGYQNLSIKAAHVSKERIDLARRMRAANERGEALGLTEDEIAFYDALETNGSAVKVISCVTGQAGEGYSDCLDAGGSVVTGMGSGLNI